MVYCRGPEMCTFGLQGLSCEAPAAHTTASRHTRGRFQSEPSTTQHPCLRASCMVVVTWVKWTATPAETRGGWEGKPKATKEQHAKEGGIHPGRLLRRRKSGSDGAFNEIAKDWYCGLCAATHGGECQVPCRYHATVRDDRPPSQGGAWNPANARGSPEARTPAKWKEGLGTEGVHDAGATGGVSNSLPSSPRKRVERVMQHCRAQGRPNMVVNWTDPRSNPEKVAEASPK